MSLDIDNHPKQTVPWAAIAAFFFGTVLVVGAAVGYYLLVFSQPKTPPPEAYRWSLKNSATADVNYFESSFFGDGPGSANKGYVSNLTDTIDVTFDYDFEASRAENLRYTYGVTANLRALYTSVDKDDDKEKESTVWSENNSLLDTKTVEVNTSNIELSPTVTVPYEDYRKKVEQLNTALETTLTTDVVVTAQFRVTGDIDGEKFEEKRTMSVTAPLNLQLYSLKTNGALDTDGVITVVQDRAWWDIRPYANEIAAAVVAIVGVGLIVLGSKLLLVKSTYERELDRIFRFHDGIIVRARRPANLANRNVVHVETFDDMLNLEEELKVPIVAAPAGDEATQFITVHEDVTYVYTLGEIPDSMKSTHAPTLNEVRQSVKSSNTSSVGKPKKPPTKHKKID